MDSSSRQAVELLARRAADTYQRSLAQRQQGSSIADAWRDPERQGLGMLSETPTLNSVETKTPK
jgi:hypothetical protein